MSDVKKIITTAMIGISTFAKIINDDTDIKSALFGCYADGRPRGLSDAVLGEYRSPKERKELEKGGKKHKKNKYKKKYKKLKNKTKKQHKKQKKYAKKYKYTI